MDDRQAFTTQRIDFGDVDRQRWRRALHVVPVTNDLDTTRLQPGVVSQLFQQSRPHEAMKTIVDLLDGGNVHADARVLQRQVIGAGRQADIIAFTTQIAGGHHVFDGAQLFVSEQLVVVFSHIDVFLNYCLCARVRSRMLLHNEADKIHFFNAREFELLKLLKHFVHDERQILLQVTSEVFFSQLRLCDHPKPIQYR